MLSYKRTRTISDMFSPNIQTTVPLYDHIIGSYDDVMDWKYQLDLPMMELQTELGSYLDVQSDLLAFDEPQLPPILNHDCMWSGRCTSHPGGCARNRSTCSKAPQPQSTTAAAAGTAATATATTSTPTQTPTVAAATATAQPTPAKQQIAPLATSTPVASTSLLSVQPMKVMPTKKSQQIIPAGQSLLRLKNTASNKSQSSAMCSVSGMSITEFMKDRDQTRPDTPLSLDDDDDAIEYKHTIDIAACTMGSNEMSLIDNIKKEPLDHDSSPTEIIKILKQHLEDNSDRSVPQIPNYMSAQGDGLDELINDIKSLSDFENETEDDDDISVSTNDSFNVSNTLIKLPMKVQPSLLLAHPQTKAMANNNSTNTTTAANNNTTTAASVMNIKQSMHSDHSYTRCKSRVNVTGLGVQTPSDSGKNLLFLHIFLFVLQFFWLAWR